MNIHSDKKLFSDTIRAASANLKINEVFIEKDYWITLVLQRLSESEFAAQAVFKGGTSLSKGFGLIERFSEDVDIAIINKDNQTGNVIKNIIRSTEKAITTDLKELEVESVTSKGSKFRKSVFEYKSIDTKNRNNRLIVEVNSFANPFPYKQLTIKSFLFDFLTQTNNQKYIEQFNLEPFEVNVLNKEQTLLEKLVSLIRFSFATDPVESISKKIRHFYDLYFLMNDPECAEFARSDKFKTKFDEIIEHDKQMFDEPEGWEKKLQNESPLLTGFDDLWKQINTTYKTELSALAYSPIPSEEKIAKQFNELIKLLL